MRLVPQVHAHSESEGTQLMNFVADSTRYAFASQLAVLRSCPDVISRLLKSGGSILLAAKVLVISRLLHTKLSKRPSPPPYLETLRNYLAMLRRRLLARIDRRFKSIDVSKETLIESMCAFSLATSSSPTDIVRHFHHIRLAAISESTVGNAGRNDSMLEALQLYVRTLKDTQTIIPGQLAQALERLKLVSLFKSQDLYTIVELNLDVHERWIGEDIKTFIPYIRNDNLNKADTEILLKQWARQAISKFLKGLQSQIQNVRDPLELIQLRKDVLELWLSQHQPSLGIDATETLDGLREVFNKQLVSIVRGRVSSLADVDSLIREIVQRWQVGVTNVAPSLWDSSGPSMDSMNGGKAFRDDTTNRFLGKDGALQKVSLEYTMWMESIEAIEVTIKSLQGIKWADEVDDMDDEDESLDNKQILLSEDDPHLLQEELTSALREAFETLQTSLHPSNLKLQNPQSGQKAVFMLRTWRELRQRLPTSYRNLNLGFNSVPELHSTVTNAALECPLATCSKSSAKITHVKPLPSRALWEGAPELPVLPSPWTYRLLREVTQSMTSFGSDIWSPQATDVLKTVLAEQLAELLEKQPKTIVYVNGHADPATNGQGQGITDQSADNEGEENNTSVTEQNINGGPILNGATEEIGRNDSRTQQLFDIFYLSAATACKNSGATGNALLRTQSSLEGDLGLELKCVERMKRGAGEYWKRTGLLFGVLG